MAEIRKHTAGPDAFRKRFFRWFDAFRAMKYVHHARDGYHPNVSVETAAAWLLAVREKSAERNNTARDLLCIFRKSDRTQTWGI
ncbi:MAG: hypothetical protein EP344_09285 [Bacteroidetes bacterium]|nr:MAG: hypothetical protein EP344_09285 [Bacteroidota bacterium]